MPREVTVRVVWGLRFNSNLTVASWIRQELTRSMRNKAWDMAHDGLNLDLRTMQYEDDPQAGVSRASCLAYRAYPSTVDASRRGLGLTAEPRPDPRPEITPEAAGETGRYSLDMGQDQTCCFNQPYPWISNLPSHIPQIQALAPVPDPDLVASIRSQMIEQGLISDQISVIYDQISDQTSGPRSESDESLGLN
jgi:hypothetical protein